MFGQTTTDVLSTIFSMNHSIADVTRSEQVISQPEKPSNPEPPKSKILIIDDDPTFLETMQDLLLDRFDVAVAEDVVAGSDILMSEAFDLLILDIRMPVVNGLEYIQMLDNSKQFSQLPILVISGAPELAEQISNLPHRAHLAKPFHPDQLYAAIQRLLDLRRPQSSASV